MAPGPESVPGATAIMAEGFVPLENLTGVFWVVEVWPEAHVRSVPETRTEWTGIQPDGRVWFVRSPWAELAPSEALSVVWAVLRRNTDPREMDESAWPQIAADVLTWPVERAREVLAEL
ncbi:MAG: hypothetical protein J2P17_28055, partial [Mycobacterium sp.]|nr:hypothetical protein [Mycobacterium sp.]